MPLKLSNGRLDPTLYNLHALKSTLRHENEHKKDHLEGMLSDAFRHVEIHYIEISHPDFSKGTKEFQEGIIMAMRGYLKVLIIRRIQRL